MINHLKQLYNRLGWKTSRKLIVITSDDWGSVRVASARARQELINSGFNMDSNRFNKYDTLESDSDIEKLFEVLLSHKDANGKTAVITALTNVANPDFKKIAETGFTEYHYEPFTETLKSYPEHGKVYQLYKKGIVENIFRPEFHGREHLNINRWMKILKHKDIKMQKAFELGFYMPDARDINKAGNGFGAAYDIDFPADVSGHHEIITSGLSLFNQQFGYSASLFTAPSLTYNTDIEKTLAENGIKVLDVPTIQKIPVGHGKYRKKLRYIGKKNKFSQTYISRNAVFEPNLKDTDNGVATCMEDIQKAFSLGKPAIISNHRAAFTGSISISNRDKGLSALNELLKLIMKKWPGAEFVSVTELYNIMNDDK